MNQKKMLNNKKNFFYKKLFLFKIENFLMFDSVFAVKFEFFAKEECDKGTIVMTKKSIFKAFQQGKNSSKKTVFTFKAFLWSF